MEKALPTEPNHGGKIGCIKCSSLDVIGLSDGDSIGYWKCRTCEHEWERDGYLAEIARRNIDQMRSQGRAR